MIYKIIGAMKPGIKVSDLWRIANEEYRRYGLEPQERERRVGHGIGLQGGESPSLSAIDHRILEVGIITTPEPEGYDLADIQPYRFHYEEVVVITKDGNEILSKMPTELNPLTHLT